MKYFTKEWYELCQKVSAHLPLEETEEAESFSEEYFQQLYNKKLTEWLIFREKLILYKAEHEAAKEGYVTYELFDKRKSSEEFHERFIDNQEQIKKILPEEILKEIADIRVFTLNKASNQVIKAVTEFCKENEKTVKDVIKEYQQYYKKASESLDKNIVKNKKFHDCRVINIKQTEKTLSILFNNSGGYTDKNEIRFQNYKIIKQDALLENTWWLYDEIYKTSGKYELHVLLQNKNMELLYFFVSADKITFRKNHQND